MGINVPPGVTMADIHDITEHAKRDPRVVEALKVLDAFRASPDGQLWDTVWTKADMAALSDDVKDAAESAVGGYYKTLSKVCKEIRKARFGV
jgi:hypothetical protein